MNKQGLILDKVVLLGRTLDEYVHFFALDPAVLRGQAVLDVASGVSSFSATANRASQQRKYHLLPPVRVPILRALF